jgi:G3E family GTPase
MMGEKTPITLITGPLGSGKTTLLRRILDGADRRLAVVMNEFGELAVDSRVIQGRNFGYVELTGGCVCCSLAGELDAALRELVSTVRPDWIVLEATGVAESDALVYTVGESVDVVRLDCVVCIVDANAAVRYPSMGHAERSQLESADFVIINKIDLVTPGELESVRGRIGASASGGALCVETVRCAADLSLLFGQLRNPDRQTPVERPGHRVSVGAFTAASGRPLDRARFIRFLEALPLEIFRAKGFVRFAGEGEWLFNYVAGRTDFEDSPAQRTEVVFIGLGADRVREGILAGFHACEA